MLADEAECCGSVGSLGCYVTVYLWTSDHLYSPNHLICWCGLSDEWTPPQTQTTRDKEKKGRESSHRVNTFLPWVRTWPECWNMNTWVWIICPVEDPIFLLTLSLLPLPLPLQCLIPPLAGLCHHGAVSSFLSCQLWLLQYLLLLLMICRISISVHTVYMIIPLLGRREERKAKKEQEEEEMRELKPLVTFYWNSSPPFILPTALPLYSTGMSVAMATRWFLFTLSTPALEVKINAFSLPPSSSFKFSFWGVQ